MLLQTSQHFVDSYQIKAENCQKVTKYNPVNVINVFVIPSSLYLYPPTNLFYFRFRFFIGTLKIKKIVVGQGVKI